MQYLPDVLGAIGNTPLIKLSAISERTGCLVLGKAEFLNPAQSIKDRAALYILRDAFESGRLRRNGIVVEGSAGNTGIGLATLGSRMGVRTVVVIPETQSEEKKQALRLAGAQVVEVPAAPYSSPDNYVRISGRLADRLNQTEEDGAIWADQFDNVANQRAHFETTGPEIWRDTEGAVDGFVCAVGTGGTLGGVSRALKARNPEITIALADPEGSSLYSYYQCGKLEAEGTSITEGIGQGRVTKNLEEVNVDRAYRISDSKAIPYLFELVQSEGLCLGGSSGINVAGAEMLAQELGPGHTIVTILCDPGSRYQSKIFNNDFLREKGLPEHSIHLDPGIGASLLSDRGLMIT